MYMIYDTILLLETIQAFKKLEVIQFWPNYVNVSIGMYHNWTHILHILEYTVKCIIAQLEIADKLC